MPRIVMDRSGELEVFARVIAKGSFSGAARSLDLTPSAVSKLISRLEARLGTRLLIRTTRAVTLTEEGSAFHDAAVRILQSLDDADQEAIGGAIRGCLRVNATIPFGTMYVAPAVARFAAENAQITVELSLDESIVDLVAQRVDVAIRMGDMPDSTLLARRLGASRRVVCASPGYIDMFGRPQTPEELEAHRCLTFTFRRQKPSWPFQRDGMQFAQTVSGAIAVNNGETMKQMTLLGAGISRVGLFHVAAEIEDGRLVPLLEQFNSGDLEQMHAVHVSGGPVPHRVRAFIDFLAEALRGEPTLNGAAPNPPFDPSSQDADPSDHRKRSPS